jgi:hypothetical protein
VVYIYIYIYIQDYGYALDEDGMPKNRFPAHWKGENGLYCAGLSKRGLFGAATDAQTIYIILVANLCDAQENY